MGFNICRRAYACTLTTAIASLSYPILPFHVIDPTLKYGLFRATKQGFISEVFEPSHHVGAFLGIFEEIAGARTSGFYCPFMHLIAVIHLHLQLIAVIHLHLRRWREPIS